MKTFSYTIQDAEGIHARPAGELVKVVKSLSSKVKMSCNGKSAAASKILAVMSLGAKKGQQVDFEVEGESEAADAETLEAFMKANL